MSDTSASNRLSGSAKAAVDYGPLLVFFVLYFFGRKLTGSLPEPFQIDEGEELYAAIAGFMPSFALAFVYSVWRERRVAPMLLISFVVVGILGTLTLVFKDKTFFYMKPTIAYGLFAVTLSGGLMSGRNLLKAAFDGALTLPDKAWVTLTRRYAVFFAVLAVSHEVIWRWLMRDCDITTATTCAGEAIWVQLKLFGFTGINILFAALQGPFLAKHIVTEKDPEPDLHGTN
ncbi:MAG: inner membrane-spanning protein YciB [Pseudomonadota bacterium]